MFFPNHDQIFQRLLHQGVIDLTYKALYNWDAASVKFPVGDKTSCAIFHFQKKFDRLTLFFFIK
jgi:hypothetical protein